MTLKWIKWIDGEAGKANGVLEGVHREPKHATAIDNKQVCLMFRFIIRSRIYLNSEHDRP
jgi:hypothetical protein